jgi:TatA/E family protein of Tat protein translocase
VGSLGLPEMIFIFVLALLVFGPRKLPELGRAIGKAMAEFRRASTDLRMAVEDEVREMEQQTRELGREAQEAAAINLEDGATLPSAPAPPATVSAEPQPPGFGEKPADGQD